MKIVIIEDERDLGVLMRNFLVRQLNIKTPEGSIRVVASLTEGLDCVREMNPDWIFIDNNLPDGKGVEAIRQLRDVHPGKPAKVVMMSAMTNLREEAFRNGADYFLDKPISFVEVKNIFTKLTGDI
ncbi:response regulator [Dyadobacter fermentans]|uniref:Response regulatory domain-containing protein n=1 Tax=Dyadobacter fermentans (strain ATCC 700827 / DSM 18053 / CIP 107007 / KCTC 52180 / NS114) TaxID=471854 RepID=C6W3J2_DYAFD|nr:response regulator [Dyadobacter fermentans]ACT93969.1 response regulator receiver and unknown domain protein [Dyadobacter fermentans DSM 18053]